jgi:hypothetical protein
MASNTIKLTDNTWTEVGSFSHEGQFKGGGVNEIVTAAAQPPATGVITGVQRIDQSVPLVHSFPTSGESWWVRTNVPPGSYSYTEIG